MNILYVALSPTYQALIKTIHDFVAGIRKQNSLWAEGHVFREKMQNECENGKTGVTRILSGVDDISINGSNKNRAPKKQELELVSSDRGSTLPSLRHSRSLPASTLLSALCLFSQYNDDDERNGVTQGDKLRALKSKRQSRSSSGSLS